MLAPGAPWFEVDTLQAHCADGAWSRGKDLFLDGHVTRVRVAPRAGAGWLVEGEVRGSEDRPYAVSAQLTVSGHGAVSLWAGDCTCPVGGDCKHAVALTLESLHIDGPHRAAVAVAVAVAEHEAPAAAHVPPAPAAEVLGAPQWHPPAMEHARNEAPLVRWLQDWDNAAGTPAPVVTGGGTRGLERYVYLASAVGGQGQALPQLQVEALVAAPKAAGGWARPQAIRTPPGPGQAVYDRATDADREALQLLRAVPRGFGYYAAHSASLVGVPQGAAGLLAVQHAASTGRLFADAGGATVGRPLRWGAPQPIQWRWQPGPALAGGDSTWVLQASLPEASATLCGNQPPLYIDAAHGTCGVAEAEGLSAAQLSTLLRMPVLSTTALQAHHADIAARLGGVVPLPPVLEPVERVQGVVPVACLHLTPVPPPEVPRQGLIVARLTFDYQGHAGWWAGQAPGVLVEGRGGTKVLLQRDGAAELAAIERLIGLGLRGDIDGAFGIPPDQPQNAWMHWADDEFVVLRDAGFAVTADPALAGWITRAGALEAALQPGGGDATTSPWFALSLGIEVDGVRHNVLPWLPDLIAAAAAHPPDPATGQPQWPPHVYLPALAGRGFVRLPTDALRPWLAALLDLVGDRAHDFRGDCLKLSRLEALRAGAALGEDVQWTAPGALGAVVAGLRGTGALPEVPLPASVRATLRPYQQQGLNWLQFLRAHGLGGVLADDMGLGKTVQTLAHIQVEKDAGRLTAPALVIAPVSLMGNWQREAARFCPGLRCLVLHGADRHEMADAVSEHDLVIAPYSLLQRDRERWLAQAWHLVVLDEAQNIKNASSQAAQVAGGLNARHRLCLSGTPMENHLGEVWSLFHFLMPGFLGSEQRFKALFRTPIEKQGDTERMAQLRARTMPFMLRRTKALVAGELPPQVESVMPVPLAGAQADLYETIRLGMEKTVREALQSQGLARSQITVLDALLKLRQVCCHPQLLPLDAARSVATSAKLDQLMALLPGMLAEGRRVLLFSQFTSMLTLIEAELKKKGLPWAKLTGQSRRRDAIIEQFTSGQVPLFLISLKAGGVGLNLPQADTVVHFDPWWNPAVEAQATGRAHRIGQAQSVWVIKLVAQGTIEERILALQERKAQLAGSLYGGAAARTEPLFTEGDLAELLAPLSQ